jgi:hypothetical protein
LGQFVCILTNLTGPKINDYIILTLSYEIFIRRVGSTFQNCAVNQSKAFFVNLLFVYNHKYWTVKPSNIASCPLAMDITRALLPPPSSIIFLPSLLYTSQNLVTKCVLQDPSYSWMIGPYQHISLDRTKLIGIHTLDNIVMQMSFHLQWSKARFLFRFLKEYWNTAGEFSTLLSFCCSFCLLKIGNVERKLGPFVASGAFQEMEKQ